jgi:hypothetical protein
LQERRAERRQQREWLREREAYGKTPSGKFIDQKPLLQLCQLGYDKALAAEALRAADNDAQASLDVLGDPVRRGALQLSLIALQVGALYDSMSLLFVGGEVRLYLCAMRTSTMVTTGYQASHLLVMESNAGACRCCACSVASAKACY